jgi:hypothetical protein
MIQISAQASNKASTIFGFHLSEANIRAVFHFKLTSSKRAQASMRILAEV